MRIVRCRLGGASRYGVLEGETIRLLAGAPYGGIERTGETAALSEVRLLAPCAPSKIVAVGINYAAHAPEFGLAVPGEPLIFLKPPSAVIGPGEAIVLPPMSRQVDYEGELAVVIGRPTKAVPAEEALTTVFGYTCINDVTARDLQKRDVQFTRAKSFDTFAPLGPWIETEVDPADLALATTVNGEGRQASRTSLMIRQVPALVSFISQVMTLLPGDVIATGTPAGVGPLAPGDTVAVSIEQIGTLANPVVAHG